ncbi:MAG: glucose-1-phosphate adenylyltransferase subunit GlgD, partial [Clostridiales bacterium]|nr:glucose-1-phosphate adenylyltransferase subunit GlgD [Clostridiales bacterium]
DYRALFACHESADADITIVACRGRRPEHIKNILVFDRVDADGRLLDASIDPQSAGEVLYSTNIMIAKKSILEGLISNANSYNQHHFQKDIIMGNLENLHIQVYVPDAYTRMIDSLQGYFDISMELLRPENQRRLFPKDAPVFTKERDDMPARYGLSAQVRNSLVADGCTIEGTVENCILFKGVSVGKGAVVRNAILMQDSVISAGACLSYVITDKNVTIRPGGELCGAPNYPLSLPKGTMV